MKLHAEHKNPHKFIQFARLYSSECSDEDLGAREVSPEPFDMLLKYL